MPNPLHESFTTWHCKHAKSADEGLFCPPEGCPKGGCARDHGWVPGDFKFEPNDETLRQCERIDAAGKMFP